jgi:parallel beta-helix repeat protein
MSSNTNKTTIILLLVFSFALASLPEISIVKADVVIYIRADGTASGLKRVGEEVYSMPGNINGSIVVERSNVVLDGNGYTLSGVAVGNTIFLNSVRNVTIKNLIINGGGVGVFLNRCSSVTISGNIITGTYVFFPSLQATGGIYVWAGNSNIIEENRLTDNYASIVLGYDAEQNIIVNNNITSNSRGIVFWESSNNLIYHNNFINNTINVRDNGANSSSYSGSVNTWDNGYPSGGNYWSNYNGTDNNEDGIGDTPYVIDDNNQDNYPLVNVIPEFPTWIILPLLIATTLLAIIYKKKLPKTSSQQS